jgi:hypothetical protein
MTAFHLATRDQGIPAARVEPPHSPSSPAHAPLSGGMRSLRARLTGPGGYYNLGNAIGLATGLIQQLAAALGGQRAEVSALGAVQDYFFGSPAATALTIAMAIFFLSGELYFRGWRPGHQPDLRLIRLGDLSSGVAALVLLVALAIIGSAWLAAASTVLLAAGKFGSAMRPGAQWRVRLGAGRTFDPLRLAVIFSRLLAMLAIMLATFSLARSSSFTLSQSAPQIVLLLCYGFWLRADVLLNSLQDP